MELHIQLKHSTDCFISLPGKIVHSLLLLSEKNSKSLGTIPLEIQWYDKQSKKENKGYVGWAGGSTDPQLGDDSIEMSPEMALSLGTSFEGGSTLYNGQKLKVKALNNIELAKSVQVEPLTSDDWEILEVHQEYLEEQLLNQVNILFLNQIVPIWIHHKTLIKLKVTEIQSMKNNNQFVKLSSSSEIIVAPKPRQSTLDELKQKSQKELESLKPRYLVVKDFIQDDKFINEIYISKQLLNKFNWNIGDIIEITKTTTTTTNKSNNDEADDENQDFDSDIDNQDDDNLIQDSNDKKDSKKKKFKKSIYSRVLTCDKLDHEEYEIYIHKNLRNIGSFFINTIVRCKLIQSHSLPICPIGSISVKQILWKKNTLSKYKPNINDNGKIYSNNELKEFVKVWAKNTLLNNQRYPLLNNSIISIDSNLMVSFQFNNLTSTHNNQEQQQQQQQQQNNNNRNLDNNTNQELTGINNNPYLSNLKQIGDMISNIQQNQPLNNNNNDRSKLNQYQLNNGIFMLNLDLILNDQLFKVNSNETFEKRKQLEDYNEIDDKKLFDRIGGMEKQIKIAKDFLSLYLYRDLSIMREQLNTPGVNGLIVAGPHGSGKSLFITAIASMFSNYKKSQSYVTRLDCLELKDLKVEKIRKHLNRVFYRACKESGRYSTSIIIFEDLDSILSTPNDQDPGSKIRCDQIVSHFKSLAFKYSNRSLPLILISSVQSIQSLCQSIQIPEIFGQSIELPAPTREERIEILEKYLKYNNKSIKNQQSVNLMKFSGALEGYLGSDVEQIVDRAIHLSSIKEIEENIEINQLDRGMIDFEIIEKAREGYTPITLKGIKLHTSEIKWEDIGGLDSVRAMLKETIEWPSKYPKLFASSPLRLRSGILLYGPTGCGKTLLANAIAGECGLNFISVKGPELLNKYIGSSEQAVRDMFSRASAAKPCVLFFDEFDSIAPRRGHDSTGVTDRVVNQFLTQLDGVEGLTGVYVLAATSRPDLIDPALLRPGRLDKSLYCNIPNYNERLDIIKTLEKKMNFDKSISLEELSKKTEFYTGADLRALMYNAQLKSIHQWMNEKEEEKKKNKKEKEELDKQQKQSINDNGGDDDFIIFKPKNQEDQLLTFEEKTNLKKQINTIKSQYINSTNDKKSLSNEEPPLITQEHLDKAFNDSSPSIPEKERKKYEMIYQNFLKDRGSVTKEKNDGPKQTLA